MAGSAIGSGQLGPASQALEALKGTSRKAKAAEKQIEHLVANVYKTLKETPLFTIPISKRSWAESDSFNGIVAEGCDVEAQTRAAVSAKFELKNNEPVLTLAHDCRDDISPLFDTYRHTHLTRESAIAKAKDNPDYLEVLTAAVKSAEKDLTPLAGAGASDSDVNGE